MTFVLHNADCLEVLKDIPDKSVDLIICDLPYGCLHPERKRDTTKWYDSAGQARGSCAWDIKIDLEAFWKEVKRVRKSDSTPTLHFCTTKFGIDLINSNPSEFRYDLVWNKQRGVSFLSANKMPMRSHEMIYVFSKKGASYIRKDITGDFPRVGGGKSGKKQYGNKGLSENYNVDNTGKRCALSVIPVKNSPGKGKHPTEKPKDLYKWLIERYSKPGDTILDPTAGSFNSCIVANEMGRHAIGIEMDKGFFDKACVKMGLE